MIAGMRRGVLRLPLLMQVCFVACALTCAWPAWAQTGQPIYADTLVGGWQNWSWATVDVAATSPVHAGARSIGVSAAAWQALYLHHAAFATDGYDELVFWIHGGSVGGQLLQVQALLGGTAQAAVPLPALAANTWQKVTIPLAALGVAAKPNMDGFWIQDRSGTTKPPFYVDDASLTAAAPPAVVNVTVDAGQILRTVDARHFGLNAAIWDAVFDTPTTISLLTEMGNRTLRFPGGSLSNDYHWQSNTTGSSTWQWETSFDDFAHVAGATGAETVITVNYGSGTPAEAAEWVRYANVTRGYGVRYWEIGNECYGPWETDVNTRPHDPVTYATRFKDYYTRMKAVDPTIRIGAVAVTGEDSYANYTDQAVTNPRTGATHSGWTPVMLATLRTLGVTPDFLVHHRYPQAPGAESDVGLLASSISWAADAADLRRQLNDYLGAAAASVELVATENNSVFTSPGKQTTSLVNGLFLADSIGTAMTTEFNGVLWWDLRNAPETGNNNSDSLYGWRLYGDYGIVNDADPSDPADRYPTFYVAKLLQYFARPGDRLVSAISDYGQLSAYAARRADGALTLLVINKSPSTALNASIAVSGYSPAGAFTVYSYGPAQDDAARTGIGSADVASSGATGAGSTFVFAVPAYSVTVLALSATAPPPPAFDYALSHTGGVTVTRGGSGTTGITATLTAGSSQSVSFSASGLPTGATAGFSAAACAPTCSSTLTISTAASTPIGTFPVVVTGAPLGRTTTFSLVVMPPPGAPALSVSPGTTTSGATVTATWNGIASPTATDWIGLYAPGAADTAYLAWIYVSCAKTPGVAAAAGSCAFAIPSTLAAGGYQLRLFASNGYTRLAISNALTVTVGPNLGVSPTSVTPGGSVTATWSGIASPTATDWIGLYTPGAADTAYLAWMYVSCSKTAGAAIAAGSCSFPVPGTLAPGGYELRLLSSNGYTRLATSSALSVTAGPSLGVSPTSVAAGGSVTATWAGIASPTTTDWIGLYAPGAADTAYLAWIYVSCSKTPGAAAMAGSCAFPIPGSVPAGTYELRLLSSNGYTRLTTSPALSVH